MRRLARLGVAATATACALSGCTESPSPNAVPPEVSSHAQAARLAACQPADGSAHPVLRGTWTCLDGGSVDLAATGGKPVVLVFFAQWCGPCRAEMPVLKRVLPQADAARVYLVNSGETQEKMAVDLVAEFGPTSIPVLRDPDWELMQQLGGAHSLPRTFLVDAHGRVVRHEGGWKDDAQLREALHEVGAIR